MYRRVWGGDGLAVTCGQRADGVLSADPTEALFYQGTKLLARKAAITFDPVGGLVSAIHCSPRTAPTATPRWPPTSRSSSAVARARWTAAGRGPPRGSRTPPASDQTYGFAAALDGGSPYRIIIDEQEVVITDCAP